MIRTDILIIGGGLTGLTLAYLLKDTDLKVVVVEARSRLGGRILTVGGQDQATIEMGATWLGPSHKKLQTLLNELDLETFKQRLGNKAIYEPTSMSPHQLVTLPENQESSYRIADGTEALINKLRTFQNDDSLLLAEKINTISAKKDRLIVESTERSFETQKVVSTLPPKLLTETIKIEPGLPKQVIAILSGTHTWMGESIKFGLTFEEPFWLDENSSGTVFSNVGPVNEMYDHTTIDNQRYAIKGFLNSSYFSLSKDDRLQMILQQLRKYYGTTVDNFIEYYEMVWSNEPLTYSPYSSHVLPHQNNGHEIFQTSYLDNRFYIAGAETSEVSPGYMDGAIHSAFHVFKKIKNEL